MWYRRRRPKPPSALRVWRSAGRICLWGVCPDSLWLAHTVLASQPLTSAAARVRGRLASHHRHVTMKATTYSLLAHITLVLETLDHDDELDAAVRAAGFTDGMYDEAESLIEDCGGKILDVLNELQHNKTVIHLVHTAATELEMWLQTAHFRARKAASGHQLEALLGGDLHPEDHTVAVIAQSQRFIAMVRMDAELRSSLGSERSVKDLLQRGNVLANKLYRLGEGSLTPEKEDDAKKALTWLGPLCEKIRDWLKKFGAVAERAFDKQPEQLGHLGFVIDSIGAPLGGTAFGVTLHKRAQGDKKPSPHRSKPAPGWSMGRLQGQNSLNHGKGYQSKV